MKQSHQQISGVSHQRKGTFEIFARLLLGRRSTWTENWWSGRVSYASFGRVRSKIIFLNYWLYDCTITLKNDHNVHYCCMDKSKTLRNRVMGETAHFILKMVSIMYCCKQKQPLHWSYDKMKLPCKYGSNKIHD